MASSDTVPCLGKLNPPSVSHHHLSRSPPTPDPTVSLLLLRHSDPGNFLSGGGSGEEGGLVYPLGVYIRRGVERWVGGVALPHWSVWLTDAGYTLSLNPSISFKALCERNAWVFPLQHCRTITNFLNRLNHYYSCIFSLLKFNFRFSNSFTNFNLISGRPLEVIHSSHCQSKRSVSHKQNTGVHSTSTSSHACNNVGRLP